jgi:hypothetical protein
MTRMTTQHTTQSIEDFLDNFAGRVDMEGFNSERKIHIAEENRDFVWPQRMQEELIISIFQGFAIPLMVICDDQLMDGGNRATSLMLWKQNKFTLKFGDWQGNYDAMVQHPTLAARWNRCVIPMTLINNATKEERSQIYENYNKGIVLSFGQRLLNRKQCKLVETALKMIGRGDSVFELKELLSNVWQSKWRKTKTLTELGFAYQILVSSMFGPAYCHNKFHSHLDKILKTDIIDLANLKYICEVIQSADPENHIDKKKKAMIFKKFISAMIYDFHSGEISRERFVEKWTTFYNKAYVNITKDQLKSIVDVKTDRGDNLSRVRRLSNNVSTYLDGTLLEMLKQEDSDDDDDDDDSI